MKKKAEDSDDDIEDEEEREQRDIEKKVARTLLQAREFKVKKILKKNYFIKIFFYSG